MDDGMTAISEIGNYTQNADLIDVDNCLQIAHFTGLHN